MEELRIEGRSATRPPGEEFDPSAALIVDHAFLQVGERVNMSSGQILCTCKWHRDLMTTTCERWLGDILAAEGVNITASNREAVERGIKAVLGEKVGLDTCTEDWIIIRNRVSKDPLVRSQLVARIREEMDKEKVAARPR